ncbi:hypothetical protein D6C91_04984 [Aureobasidium pullulans]|uniref:C3H1-type domain-containing protein n=1 Tax=Aureobasidium pullulans TaxID=5580 RepID=A0A4S9T739_AURPU|nr:hypothetical protein D6C91_04984 [Aureobasidium pullulans]
MIPVCRMWQMGRCELNSIQCEFRHAEPDFNTQPMPMLSEAFDPSPRLPDPHWDDHRMHPDRKPLQELVLPAPSSSILEIDQSRPGLAFRQSPLRADIDQDRWASPRGSPRGSPRESLRGSPRIQPGANNTFGEMQFNASGKCDE